MSPVALAPVSTAYCSLSLAPPPVSVMYQPVGRVVFVVDPAVFERVSKFSVTGVPTAVKLTVPVPVSALTGEWIKTSDVRENVAAIIATSAARRPLVLEVRLLDDVLDTVTP